MKIQLRVLQDLLLRIHDDLSRPHPFAHERVGFMTCGVANAGDTGLALLARAWHSIDDHEYINPMKPVPALAQGRFARFCKSPTTSR